jgi:hypothetical protein
MIKLLYHVSDFKVDILKPQCYRESSICFSEDCFLGFLGQYLYIFSFDVLSNNFNLTKNMTGGAKAYCKTETGKGAKEYLFSSKSIDYEYRVYESIQINKYCLSVVKNYNVLKGSMMIKFNNFVDREFMIDLNNF